MKILGKKDLNKGKEITKMAWLYGFCLFVCVFLAILLRIPYIFILFTVAIIALIIERIVALINFRHLPEDLIIMHRDCVEVKTTHAPRLIKYDNISDVIINKNRSKVFINLVQGGKVYVKFLQPVGSIDKEILNYKEKYFK